ncbi:CPn0927/CPn0928 family alpha/beta hydrolase fold protein [Criblamydia sequanensis]|uniref:Conserved putative membrane protein n=1 Tax=Candidatus Criblamydia sequanensis CRIB-18 TaxID=1437425 RepID=A0A090E0V4_9BACT|nr:CPn0927/CPn0928 family alpha/beta hydrolase fold protein [Criblamydia sequanensis]CDR34424.1 Conserved putative membrane protein [Criblamydia sequanensis CRIB-18]
MSTAVSFHSQFLGNNPFYQEADYESKLKADFNVEKALPIAFQESLIHKIGRIAFYIFSIIVFPIGIFNFIHWVGGKFIVRSSSPTKMGCSADHAYQLRKRFDPKEKWKVKRFSLPIDEAGTKIDVSIVGRIETLANKRWLINCDGNQSFYENTLQQFNKDNISRKDFKRLLKLTDSNAILFNYPDVGASEGSGRKDLEKAYKTILNFVESDKGLDAEEVISFHTSLGGGVKAAIVEEHEFKPSKKYVYVENQVFDTLSNAIGDHVSRLLQPISHLFFWDMDAVKGSKSLKVPEIILQRGDVSQYTEIHDSEKILGDGLVSKTNNLAKRLLDDPTVDRTKKKFIATNEDHGKELKEPEFLAKQILSFL